MEAYNKEYDEYRIYKKQKKTKEEEKTELKLPSGLVIQRSEWCMFRMCSTHYTKQEYIHDEWKEQLTIDKWEDMKNNYDWINARFEPEYTSEQLKVLYKLFGSSECTCSVCKELFSK